MLSSVFPAASETWAHGEVSCCSVCPHVTHIHVNTYAWNHKVHTCRHSALKSNSGILILPLGFPVIEVLYIYLLDDSSGK